MIIQYVAFIFVALILFVAAISSLKLTLDTEKEVNEIIKQKANI